MFVSVISFFGTGRDARYEVVDYHNVDNVKVLEGRVIVFHDGFALQVPLDGRHSVMIQ